MSTSFEILMNQLGMPLEMRESDAFKGAETKRSSSISSVVFGNFVLFLPKFFPSRFFRSSKPLG